LDELKPDRIDRNLNPVEYNIACSFADFRKIFFTVNENYLCAKMVDNDMFLRSAPGRRQQERGCIDRNLLGPDFYDGNKEMLQRINMNVLIQWRRSQLPRPEGRLWFEFQPGGLLSTSNGWELCYKKIF
jgi:hypothetical protein